MYCHSHKAMYKFIMNIEAMSDEDESLSIEKVCNRLLHLPKRHRREQTVALVIARADISRCRAEDLTSS